MIPQPWLAIQTARWHTNARFSATGDRNDGHTTRMMLLMLQLDPDVSPAAHRYALLHDLGESQVCDMNAEAKRENPELAGILWGLEVKAINAMGFKLPEVTDDEKVLIDLCDKLDAYLWALFHNPQHVEYSKAWGRSLDRIWAWADQLGLLEKVAAIISGVSNG